VSETEYRVVTRYISDTRQATPGLRGYGDAAKDTSRHLRDATASSMALGGAALRMVGTFVTLASVGYAIQRGLTATFRNLNEELNVSLSMAAQLNLAFQFSNDPGKNFATSLAASRDLLADIASDAAKLPGTATDYYRIASSISGAVFAAGGDTNQLRETTKLVGIAAPAAGQSQSDAANQAMRVLFGTASVGDNPLFAMMLGSQLFGPGMTTEKFNKLDPAERLEAFNTALEKIVTDDYLAAVVHTFDTQFGTLTESIVGSTGILAEIGGQELFEGLLDGLVELNEGIEGYTPTIVSGLASLRNEFGVWASVISEWIGLLGPPAGWNGGAELTAALAYARDFGKHVYDSVTVEAMATANIAKNGGVGAGRTYQDYVDEAYRDLQRDRQFSGTFARPDLSGLEEKPKRRGGAAGSKDGPATSKTVIHQTNNIQIDLKSDDSPEAVAVKVGEGMRLAARHPTMAARRPALVPAPRS
jgi:hypothetical protein